MSNSPQHNPVDWNEQFAGWTRDRIRKRMARRGNQAQASDYNWTGTFDGATSNRHRRFPAFSSVFGKDEDRAMGPYERKALRLNIREMRRNLGMVFGALQRMTDGVVGTGLVPVPSTKDKGWNKEASELWLNYQKVADYRKRQHGWEMQRCTVKSRMAEGECLFVKLANGQVQPIEAERIATPAQKAQDENEKIIDGFRMSKGGIILGAYVCDRSTTGTVNREKFKYYKRENFFHPAVPERFAQIHGIPCMSAIVTLLRDKGETEEAVRLKAKLDSFQGWQVVSSEDLQSQVDNTTDRTATPTVSQNNIRVEKHDMLQWWWTPEGTEMKSLASATPNPQYDSFLLGMTKMIAMALGIPWQVLMLEMDKASFSGARAILIMAYNTYAIWRHWLVNELLQPWWNWRIAMAMREGVLGQAPVDERGLSEWYKVDWMAPALEWVDPRGEATANEKNVAMGTTSVSRICRTKGTTVEIVRNERKQEIVDAVEAAAEINKKHPEAKVDWRDFTTANTKTSSPAPAKPSGTNGGNGSEPADPDEEALAEAIAFEMGMD